MGNIKLRKAAIIGTGHVGSHVAFSLATQGEVDELWMVDIDKQKAIAQATDVNDAVSYLPHEVTARACEPEDIGGCDILVISAGPLPRPDQDRLDTLGDTVAVLKEFLPRVKASGFGGFIISISNPADVVAAYVQRYLDYPARKIISSGTALDSARLQRLVAGLCRVSRRSLTCYALGEHGGSAMVPWSHVRVQGIALDQLQKDLPQRFPAFDREKVTQDMKHGGYLVLEGKGSTEFGIASAVTEIVRAIFHDEKKALPVSCLLQGEYGQRQVFASVPALLGKDGVEEVLELRMTPAEQAQFQASCDRIREYMALSQKM